MEGMITHTCVPGDHAIDGPHGHERKILKTISNYPNRNQPNNSRKVAGNTARDK
jgi:hypothetical protein